MQKADRSPTEEQPSWIMSAQENLSEKKKSFWEKAKESKSRLLQLKTTVIDLFSDKQSKLDEDSQSSKSSRMNVIDCFSDKTSENGSRQQEPPGSLISRALP
jgi:hypothetical protein